MQEPGEYHNESNATRRSVINKYEAHITFHGFESSGVKGLTQIVGGKFSRMEGDPVLGDDRYCYLTMHSEDVEGLKAWMKSVAEMARSHYIYPIREKIEQIIYDHRFGLENVTHHDV